MSALSAIRSFNSPLSESVSYCSYLLFLNRSYSCKLSCEAPSSLNSYSSSDIKLLFVKCNLLWSDSIYSVLHRGKSVSIIALIFR